MVSAELSTFDTTCPVFRPSRAEFTRHTFLSYVQEVIQQQPNVAMFKIIPPDGWKPTRRRPNLDKMMIHCPIKQLAFGKKGSYQCILVEQKAMSVAEFRRLADSEDRLPPPKCRNNYKDMERAFWKSVTINAPLYGADTPMSLFDDKISNGWSLKNLEDLLKEKDVPEIPGVTSPMTYFGMWKSFFAWHVEDADLYSVNFLHWGAPKIWYCIAPSDKAKFEQLAQSLNPDKQQKCKGFLRHKDILISPTLLKQYSVNYQVCKQEENEFVVLNAASYHSGFNCGFNTAEAVNFALEEWVETGKRAIPCTCEALRDQVRIDMDLFTETCSEASTTEAASSEVSGDASSGDTADSADSAASDSRVSQASSTSEHSAVTGSRKRGTTPVSPSSSQAKRPKTSQQSTPDKAPAGSGRGKSGGSAGAAQAGRCTSTSLAAAKPMRSAACKLSKARKLSTKSEERLAQLARAAKPMAIVGTGEDDSKFFQMVLPLRKLSGDAGKVKLRWLREGRDGLFRPSHDEFEEPESALVPIRTQLMDPGPHKPPGYKLLTLRSRILNTELV